MSRSSWGKRLSAVRSSSDALSSADAGAEVVRISPARTTDHQRPRAIERHSLATIPSSQGRKGAPTRSWSIFRQALNAASCTASSAALTSCRRAKASLKADGYSSVIRSEKALRSPSRAAANNAACDGSATFIYGAWLQFAPRIFRETAGGGLTASGDLIKLVAMGPYEGQNPSRELNL